MNKEANEIKKKSQEDHLFGIFSDNPVGYHSENKQSTKSPSFNSNHPKPFNSNHPKPFNSNHPKPFNSNHPKPFNSNHPKPFNSNHPKPFNPNHPNQFKKQDSEPKHPLSAEDIERQKIATENHAFVKQYPDLVSKNVQTYYKSDHDKIQLKTIRSKFENIYINGHSSIWTAIDLHRRDYKHIYLLSFADALKPGGGYLNGRGAQEETICRQTLLYPTIVNNPIYKDNLKYGPEGSDNMIYSADVLVIRGDDYNLLLPNDRFTVNIISSAAVDKRKSVHHSDAIMEDRIRKILKLAAFKTFDEKDRGRNAIILGAFGCGVFKNDPNLIASIFAKILFDEGLKDYFNCIVFPIFKDNIDMIPIFKRYFRMNK